MYLKIPPFVTLAIGHCLKGFVLRNDSVASLLCVAPYRSVIRLIQAYVSTCRHSTAFADGNRYGVIPLCHYNAWYDYWIASLFHT
jgi:hypothetical protein